VFILAGFEHSVADMFYFAVAEGIPLLSAKGFLYIIYVSIGNLLGSWIIPNLKLLGEKLIKS
jgi:formate/nitrite transporter FocA (FNT family)